ncbi:hypothetical protein BV133_708 [Blastochloris viridis]|uniref:Uncharacterized protein n=1 Tax=Blastochloris viridis TaxID=1079 RepID=A0A182D079_BLAVI|nr:hypothetical protein BV133_708 [Blastochloris viridis]
MRRLTAAIKGKVGRSKVARTGLPISAAPVGLLMDGGGSFRAARGDGPSFVTGIYLKKECGAATARAKPPTRLPRARTTRRPIS